jgi:hypothetical protein
MLVMMIITTVYFCLPLLVPTSELVIPSSSDFGIATSSNTAHPSPSFLDLGMQNENIRLLDYMARILYVFRETTLWLALFAFFMGGKG